MERSGLVPSKEKFRRMICLTFVSTGSCPYGDKCVFLHDTRLKSRQDVMAENINSSGNCKSYNLVNKTVKDTFYWPDMEVSGSID